jgi:putative transposase
MTQDNLIKLSQPGAFSDLLTDVLRNGARALLAQAVEAEVTGFLGGHADKLTDDGRAGLVRHGHLPEREIMTGIGPVAVRCPRVRDRAADGGERIRFSSAILPPYARRSKSLEVLIPILYLKGISTGDFEDALAALLGKDAGGLSASTIARLKEAWVDEHARWRDRDLSAKRYVYVWADGIYVQARLEDDALQRARHVAHLLRNFIHLFSTPLPAVFVYGPFDALGDELGERPDIHLDARAFKRLHIRRA